VEGRGGLDYSRRRGKKGTNWVVGGDSPAKKGFRRRNRDSKGKESLRAGRKGYPKEVCLRSGKSARKGSDAGDGQIGGEVRGTAGNGEEIQKGAVRGKKN